MSEHFNQLNDEQKSVTIPYFLHEGEMERLEKINKKQFVLIILLIIALIGTNAGWIIYESQFDTYYYQQDVDSENSSATALLNTGEGDVIYYGEDKASNKDSRQEEQQQEPDQAMPDM